MFFGNFYENGYVYIIYRTQIHLPMELSFLLCKFLSRGVAA